MKKKLIIAAALSTATNFQVNIVCLALKFILCWFIMLVLQLHSIKTMSQHSQRKSSQTAWANCNFKRVKEEKKRTIKKHSLTLLLKYRPSLWLANYISAWWHRYFLRKGLTAPRDHAIHCWSLHFKSERRLPPNDKIKLWQIFPLTS